MISQVNYGILCLGLQAIAAFSGGDREKDLITARAGDAFAITNDLLFTQCWFGMMEDFIAKYCVTTVASFVII